MVTLDLNQEVIVDSFLQCRSLRAAELSCGTAMFFDLGFATSGLGLQFGDDVEVLRGNVFGFAGVHGKVVEHEVRSNRIPSEPFSQAQNS